MLFTQYALELCRGIAINVANRKFLIHAYKILHMGFVRKKSISEHGPSWGQAWSDFSKLTQSLELTFGNKRTAGEVEKA